jgi:predicted secreted protein
MTIPATLSDISGSPAVTINLTRLQISRRASYVAVDHKLDAGWVDRVDGGGAVEMRVTAEGIVDDLSLIASLYSRQDARSATAYQIALADGDSHAGDFVVEELTETTNPDDGRRRFRLVLLSAGRIVHTPV